MHNLLLLLAALTAQAATPREATWVWPKAYAAGSARFSGEVFLLQAHFPPGQARAVARGPSPFPWHGRELHLVFRLARFPSAEEITERFRALAARWEENGVPVRGLQLDFDSPTAKLPGYLARLREIRQALPARYALSATGLADWLQPGARPLTPSPEVEIMFQMYQQKTAHRGTADFLRRLETWPAPFRLGLLPDQALSEEQSRGLSRNPHFHGIVRFYGG